MNAKVICFFPKPVMTGSLRRVIRPVLNAPRLSKPVVRDSITKIEIFVHILVNPVVLHKNHKYYSSKCTNFDRIRRKDVAHKEISMCDIFRSYSFRVIYQKMRPITTAEVR